MRKKLLLYYIWQHCWAFSICQSTFSDLTVTASAASATSTEDERSLISSSKESSSSLLSSRDFSTVPFIFQRNSTSQDTTQEESESERDIQSSASHTHHLPSLSSSSLDTDTKDSFYASQLQDESYATHKFNMNTCVGTCLGSASNLPQCAGRELYRGQFLCYGLTRVGGFGSTYYNILACIFDIICFSHSFIHSFSHFFHRLILHRKFCVSRISDIFELDSQCRSCAFCWICRVLEIEEWR